MRVIAVVPMKLNNRRLPGKNIREFTGGKPLCHYILSTLLQIDGIDDVYVFCSREDIKKYIPRDVKWLYRNESLDLDSASMTDVLKSFTKSIPADVYLMTHATAPFIGKNSIQAGLKAVIEGNFDSSFSVVKIQDFLWKDGKPINYDLTNIPRTQDLEPIYKESSGFYIYRKDVIERLGRRIGLNPYMVEINEIEGVDIDEEEDFIMADALNYYNNHISGIWGGIEYEVKHIDFSPYVALKEVA